MKTRARVSVPPNGTIAGLSKVTGSDWLQDMLGNGFTFRDVERVVDPKPFVQAML